MDNVDQRSASCVINRRERGNVLISYLVESQSCRFNFCPDDQVTC